MWLDQKLRSKSSDDDISDAGIRVASCVFDRERLIVAAASDGPFVPTATRSMEASHPSSQHTRAGRPLVSVRVRMMVSLMEERYAERLTVDDLARAVSRERTHVSNVFRREMGHTVHGYLTHVRMRHAADLVCRGEKVEAVMLMVGYRSKKSFYQQFRAHFGVTPGSFRMRGRTAE